MTASADRVPRGLIVSCQPVTGGPMDDRETIVRLALAARNGGANALRIEGYVNVAACDLPIVGIVKRDLADSPVRITPLVEDVRALAEAGATVVAVDATRRARPVSIAELLREIHARGCLAMADIATIDEARDAAQLGFDIIGTTMSGYTGGPVPEEPDLALVRECRAFGKAVVAEGRYNTPSLAAEAIARGATVVCVGSAITWTEHVTSWFADALARKASQGRPTLAFDIGGTKTLAALVNGAVVLDQQVIATPRDLGTEDWFKTLEGLAKPWRGSYDCVGAAVTGLVANGRWSALNPATLAIPGSLPLQDKLESQFGVSAFICNDAQAAAWGEYRFGAGAGRDLIFLTISSGIGGGIVSGGRLLTGSRSLAGSLGQTLKAFGGNRLEDSASGFGMARAAQRAGHPLDAKDIFYARDAGQSWASEIVSSAATDIAGALVNLQILVDPEVILLGGGVGRNAAFQEEVAECLTHIDPRLRPTIEAATLGPISGALGVADLARIRL
ncbi:putative N-acetylmannosamine-6-phosphate 2-epimerase [Microvirga puerhi]|uniref:Putative N-acetylmannosamine-6-phosphate 2-epimerase n=1 Tax=Microvirga puerhi TaxID=2876078 RepID=A0ABS7VMB9_9HYPH|nr:putative N-acetylmannosamine-6-phosphate 2-epimerase [Microvirga puerhi]MBZ6076685.1 putative N-acetylmannosamine-6-phosphate 2-epimerase [Microvirga puerhi]